MAITREDYVEQSVQTYVKRELFDERNYPEEQIEFLDSFDDNMFDGTQQLDKNFIASGFDFDDDGKSAELGSSIIVRQYTFEFFIIGISSVWAKNLAQAVKFAIERDGLIALLDIADAASAPNWPVIDQLTLVGVSANRVIVQDPAPWQKHIWVTRVRVQDEYDARLT